MALLATLIFLNYSSLGLTVVNFFSRSKASLSFGVMAFFASLWGVGAVILTSFDDPGLVSTGFLMFMIPPAISCLYLGEYVTTLSGNRSNVPMRWAFAAQMLAITWFLTRAESFSLEAVDGFNYAIYTLYYLIVFSHAFWLYRGLSKSSILERAISINTLSLIVFLLVNVVTNIALPIFGTSDYIVHGPISAVIPLVSHIVTIGSGRIVTLAPSLLKQWRREIVKAFVLVGTLSVLTVTTFDLSFEESVVVSYIFSLVAGILAIGSRLLSGASMKPLSQHSQSSEEVVKSSIETIRRSKSSADLEIAFRSLLVSIDLDVREVVIHKPRHREDDEFHGYIQLVGPSRMVSGHLVTDFDRQGLSTDQAVILDIAIGVVVARNEQLHLRSSKGGSEDEFNSLAERLLEEAKWRDESIAFASHQFRTPLASNNLALISMLEDDTLPTKHRERIQETLSSNVRMTEILESLLEVARSENQSFYDMKEFDLMDCVREVAESSVNHARNRGISLKSSLRNGKLSVEGDKPKVSESLHVIIENAITHATGATSIEVRVKSVGASVEVLVLDDGEASPRNESVEMKNLGIGLYAVSKIVSAHDGDMIVRNNRPKGMVYGFRLPVVKAGGKNAL